ncbi:unnamed protein product [Prorocentrum cordatum]|uniref:Uncharacterized protein n=1 Tax=Prorocentrum cordatum TaxID=2364126 RepID=A0ABN9VK59_9DINO|nr:unnamed protein product [Polarella glacialis]
MFAQRTLMFEESAGAGWQVQGPATTLWALQTHADANTTPKQHHFWWRQVLGLVSTDLGVEEHCFPRELLEIAVARGGVNMAALEAFETVSRRFQLWGEFCAEALRIDEAGDHGGDLDERRLFSGNRRSRGLAIVSPALEQCAAAELQEESAVLKERRKGALVEVSVLGALLKLWRCNVMFFRCRLEPRLPTSCGVRLRARVSLAIAAWDSAAPEWLCDTYLARAHGRAGPPPSDFDAQGAFRVLQGPRSGYADSLTDGKIATYRRGEVSLPRVEAGGVSPDLQSVLVSGQGLLREDHDRDTVLLDAPMVPAMDVNLGKGGADCGYFFGELCDLGAIEVCSAPAETREALAAPETDGSIAGQQIAEPSAEVEVCFYQCELPRNLRPFFALKAAHLTLTKQARPSDSWVLGKVPTEPISSSHAAKILNIDIFAVVGPARAWPGAATAALMDALTDAGVPSAMGPDSDTFGARGLLGFFVFEHRAAWAASARKFWKVKGALETKIRRIPLRPSVRKELKWHRALLPLVTADMSRPWSSLVTSYDASPMGAWRARDSGVFNAVASDRVHRPARRCSPGSEQCPEPPLGGRAMCSAHRGPPQLGGAALPRAAEGSGATWSWLVFAAAWRLASRCCRPTASERSRRPPTWPFLGQLIVFSQCRELPQFSAAAWDLIPVDFIERRCDKQESRGSTVRALHALLWAPQHPGGMARSLSPQSFASMRGWTRLSPPASQPPLPRQAACAVAGKLLDFVKSGRLPGAWSCSRRTAASASCWRCGCHIISPDARSSGAAGCPAIVLNAAELQAPSRTGEMDGRSAFDLAEHRWSCSKPPSAPSPWSQWSTPRTVPSPCCSSARFGSWRLGRCIPRRIASGAAGPAAIELLGDGPFRKSSAEACGRCAAARHAATSMAESDSSSSLQLLPSHVREALERRAGRDSRLRFARLFGQATASASFSSSSRALVPFQRPWAEMARQRWRSTQGRVLVDLLNDDVYSRLRGWISGGVVLASWSGTPCGGLAWARRGPPGSRLPRAPRGPEHPHGLPRLEGRDQRALEESNKLAHRALGLPRLAASRDISGGGEDPNTSYLWDLPSRKRFADRTFSMQPSMQLQRLRCHGRGVCDYAKQPRENLLGTTKGGGFFTSAEAADPVKLANTPGQRALPGACV